MCHDAQPRPLPWRGPCTCSRERHSVLSSHGRASFTFQDIFNQATEDRLTSAKELPYFEGDFWPNVLEESIKELEQEEEERKKEESSAASETTEVKRPRGPSCTLKAAWIRAVGPAGRGLLRADVFVCAPSPSHQPPQVRTGARGAQPTLRAG